jgi:AraC-like DNA-binding protein
MPQWTDQLPRPKLSYGDGHPSEGIHGPEAHALAYDIPARWPLFILEAGYAVWTRNDYWRRVGSERLAVEVVTAGDMRLQQNGRDYVVGPGQAMILQRNATHVYATGPGGFARKRFVTLTGPGVGMVMGLTGLDRLDVVSLPDPGPLVAAMRDAHRLLKAKPGGYEKRVSALAYAVLNELVAASSARRSDLVRKAVDHMHRNPHVALTNADLAQIAGVTPGYLVRRFQAEVGQTPLKYHLSLKLVLAQRLLQTTSGAVKEIAARTGFEDPLYFSRVFSRAVGTSPRRFRTGRPA